MGEKKIALVTGATRGIGKAIALSLARDGIYVIALATSQTGVDAINDYLKKDKLIGHGAVVDVTLKDSVDSLMAQLARDNTTPDILINNAGITCDNLLLRMEEDEWYKVLETNLNAVFRLSRAVVKTMFRNRWGRIITIGSVVGSSGNAGQTNYTASKAGVIGFSKSLAQEMGSRGITVNVVAPGFIDTDMTQKLPELMRAEMVKRIAVRRLGKPEDIASIVSFLVSEKASYITGETIHVNGGMYMH